MTDPPDPPEPSYPDRPTIEMVPRHIGGTVPTYWMIAMPDGVPYGPYATRAAAQDQLDKILSGHG